MANQKNLVLSPVLKWVGGKRQLLNDIIPMIPKNCSTYVEPFIGGGAVLFELQPKKAIINDFNSELINVYTVIRDYPEELIKELQFHKDNNTSEHFYAVREYDRKPEFFSQMTPVQKAARVIYLNKTCYNGLYRVNSAGQFNSPYGKYKNPNIVNETVIRAMSKYFNENNIVIKNEDFKEALKGLRRGAFVYLDPPYMPISSSSSFTGYTENGFNEDKQRELKELCDKLDKKGIKFLQSNSDCEFIRELYSGYRIKTIKAKRAINSKGNSRGEINEVLIYNYE
ncbi:DNA adenine methylase [Thomasclavelia cocleata]|jgi:DNA adenine methylase|uniref:Site-specific DNA-methyltransferase (adenine-specific) n=1 Tax=Thomasclavelia cocleata TaxID=69824 RepID=A0A1I0D599_9FIRM|nr:DNA adenine methylase [Thomasclavelia cocleata]MCR1960481.1 DNA adenine methylase [Thomasclavelia cocleata]NDO42018.1 DNA adenine methylase [Thomasclavelia cocleata]PJN80950.1 modification methylase [Thomasclavelia cocleata]SET27332.1 DNA adenine methylase [Thomasclavelia cocleata]